MTKSTEEGSRWTPMASSSVRDFLSKEEEKELLKMKEKLDEDKLKGNNNEEV